MHPIEGSFRGRLEGCSMDYVHPYTGSTLGLQHISSQVFAAEIGTTPSVGVLRTQRAPRLQAAQTPAEGSV